MEFGDNFWRTASLFFVKSKYIYLIQAFIAGKKNNEYSSIETILKKQNKTLLENIKCKMHRMVKSFGFWGILISASIPNPLFDLAGIICGQFGISFSTFFMATFIGKTLIKGNIQSFLVVLIFSKDAINNFVDFITYYSPFLGEAVLKLLETITSKFKQVLLFN